VASGHLTARRDRRGRPWFRADEVERLALERTRRACPDPGELAARAFALFDSGAGPRDLVVKERLAPDDARELHGRWVELGGGVVIDSAQARRLADALGMSGIDLDVVERALVALRRVAGALRVPCSACGQEGYVRQAREFGPSWRCAECEAAASSPRWGYGE
jgi:predicted RNA-binding Zn-ribbon protein involved in translation (DUF1610 family)